MNAYWLFGEDCPVCARFEHDFVGLLQDTVHGIPEINWITVDSSAHTDRTKANHEGTEVRRPYVRIGNYAGNPNVNDNDDFVEFDLSTNAELLEEIWGNNPHVTPFMMLKHGNETRRINPGKELLQPQDGQGEEHIHPWSGYHNPEFAARYFMRMMFNFYVFHEMPNDISDRIKVTMTITNNGNMDNVPTHESIQCIPHLKEGEFQSAEWITAFNKAKHM